MVLDGCDGRVARLTHTSSAVGVEFDSLADMCAFGMAPALVMYQWCLHDLGRLGWAAAFVYCAGAGLRLARFNTNVGVVDKSFHSGKSVPFWVLIAAVVVLFVVANDPALVVFILFCLYALSGFVYQFYLWYTGQDNPVRPKEDEIELDEPEETVEEANRQ